MSTTSRLTVVMTHPIQYYSPWFRFIASDVSDLELTVLYASEPSPSQQGAQFGTDFVWDIPLREGYRSKVLRPTTADADFGSERFWGVNVSEVGAAIEQSKPDAVLVSGWHSITLVRAILACRRRRIPLLYRGDTHLAGRGWSPLWRARTRWLLGRFDRYLSVGTRVREYLRSFGVPDTSIHDSPHAVDNEFFAASARPFQVPTQRAKARSELGVSEDAFVVLLVGKLESRKRPEDLLQALPRLAHVGKPAMLLVVGSGPLEPACRELAAELAVAVRWCGFMNQSELGRAYGISDCLALPSAETWGLVVNESMATGLPCVVSDRVGCAPDLVENGHTGEVFSFGDPTELARALERVRTGPSRAGTCRERVHDFSFEAATKGLLAACRGAMG